MLLAAGLGTRLKPFTDTHPKALAVVNGKTLLQRNLEYLAGYGISEVVVNIHHFPDQIIEHLHHHDGFGMKVHISDERTEVLETGGGLVKASHYLTGSDPFLLMNVDILTNLNIDTMLGYHVKMKSLATLAVTRRTTSRYFLFDENERLCGWRNIKTGEQKIVLHAARYFQKAFSGIHIISTDIFPLINQTGKFSMVDVYLDLAARKLITAFDHTGDKFADVGTPESLEKASAIFS